MMGRRIWLGLGLGLLMLALAVVGVRSPLNAAITWGKPTSGIRVSYPVMHRSSATRLRVTTAADEGEGSLRWAIAQANAHPNDTLIDLTAIQSPIYLHSPLPPLRSNMALIGSADTVISGNHLHRVLTVDQGRIHIAHLTLAEGMARGADGVKGAGGAAGMGGGLLMNGGAVILNDVHFVDNHAVGGAGTDHPRSHPAQSATNVNASVNSSGDRLGDAVQDGSVQEFSHPLNPNASNPSDTLSERLEQGADVILNSQGHLFKVNRGAILDVDGIGLRHPSDLQVPVESVHIASDGNKYRANRGAIAGVHGIGMGGIGAIAFGGGGGFGGFGNAGNGGNGGNGGRDSGDGGNGGDGGDGGVGIFGDLGQWEDEGSIGAIAFGGGGGFGGFGNAGNGGNGGNAVAKVANGGDGGNGGNGGFGGGGGSGGVGGNGGTMGIPGAHGQPGNGGFGGGDGTVNRGGGGGGLGGAVFVHAGRLVLYHTAFERNGAMGGSGAHVGQGKGGAVFIMPASALLADGTVDAAIAVLGSRPIFVDNRATDAAHLVIDNDDLYGQMQVYSGL